MLSGMFISSYFIFVQKIWYHNLIGTQIDKNFSGALLAIYSQFAFLLFYYQKRKNRKIIFALVWIFLNIGVFYSGSRASILVSLIGTVLIVLEDMVVDAKKRKNVWKVLLFIALIVLAYFLIPKLDVIMSNTAKLQWYWNRYFKNSYVDTSNNTRITYWISGIKLWLHRPIFGNGPGFITLTKTGSAVAHNTIIDYLDDIGLVGTCGFLAICVRAIKRMFLCRKRTFRSLPISLFTFSMILSLNRSVLLWLGLVLCWNISNNSEGFFDEISK
jgi:O-antigen ligase